LEITQFRKKKGSQGVPGLPSTNLRKEEKPEKGSLSLKKRRKTRKINFSKEKTGSSSGEAQTRNGRNDDEQGGGVRRHNRASIMRKRGEIELSAV